MLGFLSIPTPLSGFQTSPPPPPPPPPSRDRFRPCIAASAAINTSTYAFKQEKVSTGLYLSAPREAARTSLYDVLGVAVGASNLEIKAAYRRLARVFHPDVAETGRKDLSADEFMRIHSAYTTLSDPEKRAVYDSKLLRARHQRPLTSVSKFTGYGGRRWETDQCW